MKIQKDIERIEIILHRIHAVNMSNLEDKTDIIDSKLDECFNLISDIKNEWAIKELND